jgi:hypothetical protein
MLAAYKPKDESLVADLFSLHYLFKNVKSYSATKSAALL